jgi:hypothetical protein
MTDEKVFELANKLLERTKAGTQHWEATVSEQAFLTAFPKYSVEIGQVSDQYGEDSNIVIRIFNETGAEIETSRDDRLAQKLPSAGVYDVLGELYREARRSALNVDGALNELLASMQ